MLPQREIDTLLQGVADAAELAGDGNAPDGYEVLLAGMHRVRDLFSGEPWGRELIQRWQEALDRYAAEYGIPRA